MKPAIVRHINLPSGDPFNRACACSAFVLAFHATQFVLALRPVHQLMQSGYLTEKSSHLPYTMLPSWGRHLVPGFNLSI